MALAKVSGTKIRGAAYHLNLPIPAEIQHLHGGKTLLTGSLKTSDHRKAGDAVTVKKAKFIEQIEGHRRSQDLAATLDTLTAEQRTLYNEAGGLAGLLERFVRTPTALTFMQAGAPIDEYAGAVDPADIEAVGAFETEIAVAEHSAALAVMKGRQRREGKILKALGQNVEVPGGEFEELPDVAPAFAKSREWTVQNVESLNYTMRRWTEFHGRLPLANITREHLWQFDEAAKSLPVTTEKNFRAMPMRRAIEAGKRRNLPVISDKTRIRLVQHLKQVMAFASDRGLGGLGIDPWAGYKVDVAKGKVSEGRKRKVASFTPAQVGEILDFVAGKYRPDTADYWLPALGAFSGARREELGQLLVADVVTDASIPHIKITDEDEAQKVKNSHSMRSVPVPPALLKMGFLEFVEGRRKAGARFLFVEDFTDKRRKTITREVQPDARGRLTEAYGKRFSRYVLEALDMKTRGQGFHALRHSWTDAARRAGIDPEIRRLIAGRLDGEDATEAGYGNAALLGEKLEALAKMEPFVVTREA